MKKEKEEPAEEELRQDAENQAENESTTVQDNESEEPENALDKLLGDYNKLNDTYLRLMADFDNYKKKTLKEKSDLLKYGGESIVRNLLPIIDDFERAIAHLPEGDDPNKEGFKLIYGKFQKFISDNGVTVIETDGAVFDTDLHEAVTTFPAPDESMKGKVMDCTQKGYMYRDKVIRYAKVVVAQ